MPMRDCRQHRRHSWARPAQPLEAQGSELGTAPGGRRHSLFNGGLDELDVLDPARVRCEPSPEHETNVQGYQDQNDDRQKLSHASPRQSVRRMFRS